MSTQLHYRLRRSLLEKKGVGSRERKVLEAGRTTEDEMQARGRGERERASKGQREHATALHRRARSCKPFISVWMCPLVPSAHFSVARICVWLQYCRECVHKERRGIVLPLGN